MEIKKISPFFSVSPQIEVADVAELAALGFRSIVNNRPDMESDNQPPSGSLAAAAREHGIDYHEMPVIAGKISDADVQRFADAMAQLKGPVLGFCRTGTRSTSLWALSQAGRLGLGAILATASEAGYDLDGLRPRLEERALRRNGNGAAASASMRRDIIYDVVIVGGGSAGIALAASLKKRKHGLDIAIIEPRERHFYQPGFTLAGGGIFERSKLACPTADVMPGDVRWIKVAAAAFDPARDAVILEDGSRVSYRQLAVAPGLQLDWDAVDGLRDTLGKNGVTSNYRFDLTSYTWQLVQGLQSGRAIFTQPPMPIKCAGAPQKAMYLSCDHWFRQGHLHNIDVQFCNAGGVLFGVDTYVPALMKYIEKYDSKLNFMHNLEAIDGPARKAWFRVTQDGEDAGQVEMDFDMIHVCPPQTGRDFVRNSPLADADGWLDVSPRTLQHVRYDNVYGLGDGCSAPNAKTMAAARKQAPVVAENVLAALDGREPVAAYDGYGSCPLTVERGKVVLAEFGYGGKLLPTFPRWLVNGSEPSRIAWLLKEKLLPGIYYKLMLRGREWFAEPESISEPVRTAGAIGK